MKATTIITAALKSNTITTEERQKLEGMNVYHSDLMKEPGYTTTLPAYIVGDFNATDLSKPGDFGRACDLLERVGECEWDDEWATCEDCGGLFRTSPDCYSWGPSYVWVGECERVCSECVDCEEYLGEIANDPGKACPEWIDPTEHGWKAAGEDYESGLHRGQTDNPAEIADSVPPGNDYVFQITSRRQFGISFAVYLKRTEKETESREHLRTIYKLHRDGVDPWGSAMAFTFALCDYISDRNGEVPGELHYKQGLGGPDMSDPIFQDIQSELPTMQACERYARIMDKYIAKLVKAGKDY